MEAAVEDGLRALHEFVGRDEFTEEVREAKEDFFSRVVAPLPGEGIEEQRLSSFVEWFIFDRQLAGVGRTPVEEFLRNHAEAIAEPTLEVLRGAARTVHSIFRVAKRTPDGVDLKDLYTGIKYKGVKRAPLTLGKGDLADLRLINVNDGWYGTDALCYHPYEARKQIKRMLKVAKKQGKPVDRILEELMAMNTRYERYPKTAKRSAYEGGGPLA
jgi:hypothetical protein